MKRSYLVRSVIVVLCLLISLWQTEFSLPLLWERGHYFIDTVGRMFPPDISFLDVILVPLRDTVYISLLGTVFGGIIGAAGTVLCNGYVNQWKAVRIALKAAVHVFRCIPVLILALLCTFVFGLGMWSGIIAVTLSTGAVLSRLGYEDSENERGASKPGGSLCGSRYFRVILPTCCICWNPMCVTLRCWVLWGQEA